MSSYLLVRDALSRRLHNFLCLWLVNTLPLLTPECPSQQSLVPLQVQSYTAIGDSFAAGLRAIPGAHLPWCDDKGSDKLNCTTAQCLRNIGSYPYQLSVSDDWNIPDFQFLACAGSNTISCKDNQVGSRDFRTPDIVSIHIGGNNNDSFGPVMMNCVYKRGWGCEEALKKAESTIEIIGVHFDDLFDAIRAKPRRNSSQSRHVFAMGYPTFYNTTAIGSCQSWQINWPSPGKGGMRERLNNLTNSMNEQIKNATIRAGDGFHFVDADPYFKGHRLCDQTDEVWFQYLLEWKTTGLPAIKETEYRELAETVDFQDGPFHPNANGHKAFLKALTDSIRRVQRDEQGGEDLLGRLLQQPHAGRGARIRNVWNLR